MCPEGGGKELCPEVNIISFIRRREASSAVGVGEVTGGENGRLEGVTEGGEGGGGGAER